MVKAFIKSDYRVVATKAPNGELVFGVYRAYYSKQAKDAYPHTIDEKPVCITDQISFKNVENEVNALRRASRKAPLIGWPSDKYLQEFKPDMK